MTRIARVVRGLTQSEVAALLNPPRSQVFVHRVEVGGPARVTRGVAEGLAQILDSTVEELFEEASR